MPRSRSIPLVCVLFLLIPSVTVLAGPDTGVLEEVVDSRVRFAGSRSAGDETGTLSVTVDEAGRLTVMSEFPSHYSRAVFDADFRLIESEDIVRDAASQEDFGFRERRLWRNGDGYRMEEVRLNGRTKEKDLKSDPDNIHGGSLESYYEALLRSGLPADAEGSVKVHWIPNPAAEMTWRHMVVGGGELPARIEHDYPGFFRDYLVGLETVHVIESGLTGIAATFYPHKFYYAYTDGPSPRLVAVWGGRSGRNAYYLTYR